MKSSLLLLSLSIISVLYYIDGKATKIQDFVDKERCTAIGVGPKASFDGSTMTTHNNDCQECDLRITHVPAKDWPIGSKRPIHAIRDAYPRYIERKEDGIHGDDYLLSYVDTSIYNWTYSVSVGYIDQVPHTYAYTLGTYGIQNEKQVSIGESTCSSLFVAKPIHDGGKALFHMETLTEIALERCATAKCAIQTMGDLSTTYGFYGDGYDGDLIGGQDEAGEALTISDPYETWMFHVMADDTGASAIWVAQRVPDDHITAVANAFVITEIDLSDTANFMASSNIHDVAIRNNLWSPNSNIPFNFLRVYGTNRHSTSFACTRRVWRVFTLAAPSIVPFFSPYTDGYGSFGFGADGKAPYPFSVKPDKLLTVQDIFRMNRDQFEGTVFDMTKGVDAGPFGDPTRPIPESIFNDEFNGVSRAAYDAGIGFQRHISLWRTAYSTVTQSRASLPDIIGAVTWIAPYAPHHSTFVPIYASAPKTPISMKAATEYKFDSKSNWWIHCLTSNYLSRWYVHTIDDIVSFQKELEFKLFSAQKEVESAALLLFSGQNVRPNHNNINALDEPTMDTLNPPTIPALLQKYQDTASNDVLNAWWQFFFQMVGKYRDVYKIVDIHVENFNRAFNYLTVPRWWFEQMGYWGAPGTPSPEQKEASPVYPLNVPSEDSKEIYDQKYPNGFYHPYPSMRNNNAIAKGAKSGNEMLIAICSCTFGAFLGALITYMICQQKQGYAPILG